MANKKKNGDVSELAYDETAAKNAENAYYDSGEYDRFNSIADEYATKKLSFGELDSEDQLERILSEYSRKGHSGRKGENPVKAASEKKQRAERKKAARLVPEKKPEPEPEPEPAPPEPVSAEPKPEPQPEPPKPAVPEASHPYEPPVGDYTTKLNVPKGVLEVIDLLKAHTYTSYLVGDCVNMLVLGERVMDFDIACNAAMERIIAICEDRFKVRQDLVDRGELIIINGGMGISVAPYRSRIDGSGKPIYCDSIDEDLRRRTFTSETVAYNPDSGIYDPFGGLACITAEKTVLRAIDEERFEQLEEERAAMKKKSREQPQKIVIDAIRENPECILMAMQKFARGEADISPYTLRNINENAELTDMMLPAEVARYFRRILTGRRISEALTDFREVVFRLFPVLRQQYGFDQKSSYQSYTLYEHTAKAVGYAAPDYTVRLALLLHDIGKPDCAADRGDYNTYYGHSERGVMLARDVFEEYDTEDSVRDRVLFLIAHHDDHITPDNLTEFVTAFGTENTRLLLLLQSANIRAKSTDPVNERVSNSLRQLADNINAYAPPPTNYRNLRGLFGR